MRDNFVKLITEDDRQFSSREIAERIMAMPEDVDAPTLMSKLVEWKEEAARQAGVEWPAMSVEQLVAAGLAWYIFPNLVILATQHGAQVTRVRPNENDPNSCLFDAWNLARYAPGQAPPFEPVQLEDWRDGTWTRVQIQDLRNKAGMQRGLHARPEDSNIVSPRQESTISNYHRALDEYLTAE